MDFGNNYYLLLFELGPIKIYLTDTLIATWVVMALLIGFALVVRLRVRHFKEVPQSAFQHAVEAMVEQIDNLGRTMMGPELQGFYGLFLGVFAFIILSNYIGLVGLRPPTADLATTLALALLVFILIHITGIVREKGRYFKSYIEPNPIFLPINIVGEISKPVSLGFRLFGNILGGLIIVGIIYELLPTVLTYVLPSAIHGYFDVLIGALQAFIFTVLSMTFIRQKAIIE